MIVRTGQTERARTDRRAVTDRPSTATRRSYESPVAIALLAVLMAVAWGSYVLSGGLTSDDWAHAAFEDQYGYLAAAADAHRAMGSKPLLALLLPLPSALFGTHVAPQIALGLTLGILLAGAFYLALRQLTFRAYEAGPIAALLVLFPWSDSMRLWVTGSLNQVSVILYLLGLVLALRGLANRGRRGYLLHLAAVSLYAAAILAYDAVAVLALITGAVYLLLAARRRALARWTADIIVVAAADAYDLHAKTKTVNPLHVTSLHAQLDNAAAMGRGAATLVMDAMLPGRVPHWLIAIGLIVMLAAAAVIARRPSAVNLRRWLAVAAMATVAIAACYATFVPAAYYAPQQPHLYNRVNLVAALGIVVLVYALLRIAAALVLYASSDGWRPVALATVATVAIGAGYWPRIQEDKRLWAQAAAEQRAVLSAVRRAVPDPQPYDRLFVFGARAQVASRLPVFFDSWDLWTAVQLTYGNATLSAYPVFTGAYLYCGDQALWPIRLPTPSPNDWTTPLSEGQSIESNYGHFWFVDARHATAWRIGDPNTCKAALKTFTPGPYQ